MALVVEDASGRPLADAYVSLAVLRDYLEKNGLALPAGITDAEAEAAIRRGTLAVDLMYADQWAGRPLTADQGLAFPREGIVIDGRLLPASPLPRNLIYAVCEAAWREAGTPGSLFPDRDLAERVVSESVGPISVDYAPPSDQETSRGATSFPVIERLLCRLTRTGSTGSGFTALLHRF